MKYDSNNKIIYEVGDWVFYIGKNNFDNSELEHKAYQVSRLSIRIVSLGNGLFNETYIENVRPATQEEINEATKEEKIMIGELEVIFDHSRGADVCDFVKVGCQKVKKETFLKIGRKAGWIK